MNSIARPSRTWSVLFAVAAVFGSSRAVGEPAVTKTVTIEAMAFVPPEIEVAIGEKITWVNKDLVPHTVTSESGGFDSGAIAAPDSGTDSWSYTFKTKGRYEYVCTYHPVMKAVVIVK